MLSFFVAFFLSVDVDFSVFDYVDSGCGWGLVEKVVRVEV